jgi:hypothetical protein
MLANSEHSAQAESSLRANYLRITGAKENRPAQGRPGKLALW